MQVHGANDVPLLEVLSQATIDENGTKTISFKANDLEGEVTTQALANNGDIVTDQDGTVTYTPKADFSGKDTTTVTTTVTTTDDKGATVVKTVQVTVNEVIDVIEGTAGNDRLTGTVGQDIIIGKEGNDYIFAGGKDSVDGGEGVDVALFNNDSTSYFSRKTSSGSLSVEDKIGNDGIDTLHDVETLRFAHTDINVQEFTENPVTAGFEFNEEKDAHTYNPETTNNQDLEDLQASPVEIDIPAVDIPTSKPDESIQTSFTTNVESGPSSAEETKSFAVSQESTNDLASGAVDTSDFIVTSNENSLEEIPAMDEQDIDIGVEDAVVIEDHQEPMTIQEEVPAV